MTWRKWLHSFAGVQKGTRTIRRTVSPFRPGLEVLEGREVPSGNVTASLIGTVLTITGDGLDNNITIVNDGTNYNVSGTGTTINFQSLRTRFPPFNVTYNRNDGALSVSPAGTGGILHGDCRRSAPPPGAPALPQ